MKSITRKTKTLRKAIATARVSASREAIGRMRANDLPKKDVLVAARIAAVMAAKKTPDVIPYCHPVPIDSVEVAFEVADSSIDISVSVEAIWKTGVEMEALTACSVAALTIYDMLKPIDKSMVIERIQLEKKVGGKSDYAKRAPKNFKAAVVVISDSTFKGEREDRSGVVTEKRLREFGIKPSKHVTPDDEDKIVSLLGQLVEEAHDLIVTTGGTGVGPRDVTVEATRRVIEKEVPGIMEAARVYGQERTPYAMLSRGIAGVVGRSIIVNLPGSSKGTLETLDAVFPGVLHAYGMLRGEGH